MSKPYTLTTPCKDCPFRSDIDFYLSPDRVRQIATELHANGGDFYCHKTLDYGRDDHGGEFDPSMEPRARVCAGALSTLENEERPTQTMRIAERLGIYDRTALDPDAPVYESINEWVRAKTSEPLYPDGE